MDVSAINDLSNQNQINNQSGISSQQANTSSVSSTKAVTSTEKDASNVAIKDLTQGDKNKLSLTLKTLNDGIATSKISQNALQKQEEILNNVSNILDTQKVNNLNEEDQNYLKKEIIVSLQNFNEVAQNTKYENNALLNQDEQYLNIATSNSSFSIQIPNTTTISDNLITSFRQTDLTNPESLQQLSNAFKESATMLNNSSKELQSVEKNLQTVAKDTIEEQMTELTSKAASSTINFGKEALDFSKNNVTSQLGFLVSSQANTVQAQSVRLLS